MDHYTSEPRLYSSLYPHGIHQSLFLLDDAQLLFDDFSYSL